MEYDNVLNIRDARMARQRLNALNDRIRREQSDLLREKLIAERARVKDRYYALLYGAR